MAKCQKKAERTAKRESKSRSEMYQSYAASEWLLKEITDQLGYRLYVLHKEARMLDVTEEFFTEFMHEKLLKLADQALKENIEKYGGRPLY